MVCEIISIGTELLTGNTVNTNTAYIASKIMMLGINMYHQSVVGDNPKRLVQEVEQALSRSDIVITTGGLGPTYDDLSKETICKVLGKPLIENKEISNNLKEYFVRLNRDMSPSNLKQAYMPEDAVIIPNHNGTAPGLILTTADNKTVILLPGPPRELIPMVEDFVFDYLAKMSAKIIVCRNLNSFGFGESAIYEYIKDYASTAKNPSIATYVNNHEVAIRITASGENKEDAQSLIGIAQEKILSLVPKNCIYGIDSSGIEDALVTTLKEKNLKIATAESCTGGLISKRITDISGASEVFECGVCSYGNNIKESLLGVLAYKEYGAVSKETAIEMAEGIRKISGADIGISTTGIAGPLGGSDEKPVGLVYVGISTKNGTEVHKLNLKRSANTSRDTIRFMASSNAIYLALKKAGEM